MAACAGKVSWGGGGGGGGGVGQGGRSGLRSWLPIAQPGWDEVARGRSRRPGLAGAGEGVAGCGERAPGPDCRLFWCFPPQVGKFPASSATAWAGRAGRKWRRLRRTQPRPPGLSLHLRASLPPPPRRPPGAASPWDATLAWTILTGGGPCAERQSPELRNQLRAGPGAQALPGVAPRSVRTGLQSQVPALVAGTPARCPGLATQPPPGPPPACDRGLGSRWPGDPCHSRAASAQQGPCAPVRWSSSSPRRPPRLFSSPRPPRTGGGRPEVLGSSPLGPEGPSWLHPARPSSCCSAAPFPLQ